ncbi:hypothetical protein M3O96_11095 [Aquiflexum sp. TKW24L]|nr:hypothetical protein [Aquiflexum sp. TKW24L]
MFLIFPLGSLYAQDSLSLQLESKLSLVSQEIPGLSFVLEFEETKKDLRVFSLNNKSGNSGLWISDTLSDFNSASHLRDTVFSITGLKGELAFLIFGKKAEKEAVEEFVDNLIRNELLSKDPSLQDSGFQEGELLMLASRVNFYPYYKLKTKILTDTKMLLLLATVILFLLASVILVTIMYVIKVRKGKRDALTLKFKELSFEPISNLLFEYSLEELQSFDRRKIESFFPVDHLKNNLFKDVMILEILSLNKNMKGDFKAKLKTIYRKLGLDTHSIQKLSSKKWDVITSGIVEINEMDVVEAVAKVTKFAQSENFYIRSNAVATLLNISNDPELRVLVDQDFPLSRWQQMIYFRIIKFINNTQQKVRVDFLFDSKNESVRVFGYKLVRFLGLFELLEIVNEKYKKASVPEKLEMIKCFDAFSYQESLRHLHRDLSTSNMGLFLGIVSALQNIGNPISEVILVEKLKSDLDFDSRKAVMQALHALNPNVLAECVQMSNNPEVSQIYEHLMDPVLSNV